MKKGFSIILLSLFLVHFAGFYVFFAVRLTTIRQEIRETLKDLPDDRFEILQLSKSDYNKARTGENEIEWKGKMYDIGKIRPKGDQVVLYVIHDKAEDDLLSFLNEIIKRSESDSWKTPSPILAFISLIFIPSVNTFQFGRVFIPVQIAVYVERPYSVTLPIDSPPPQFPA